MMNIEINTASFRRWVFLMGACFSGLAALSFFRLWYIGTPGLDDLPMNIGWEVIRRAIYFLLMSGVVVGFLKLLAIEFDGSFLRKLLFASLILQVITSLTPPLTSSDIFSNLSV